MIGMGMKRQRDDTRAQGLAAHHQIDWRSDRAWARATAPVAIGPLTLGPNPPDVTTPIGNPSAEIIRVSFARRRTAVRPHAYALTIRAIRECVLNPLSPRKAALDASALLNRPGESGFDRVYRLIEFMPVKARPASSLHESRAPRPIGAT